MNPSNLVYQAHVNSDRHTNMFAALIPTEQYKLTNQQLYCAASMSVGTPSPICIPHLGTKLVRKPPEEDEDDDEMTPRGDAVDAFGFNVSAAHSRVALGKNDTTSGYISLH
jgi:hypothetical protein